MRPPRAIVQLRLLAGIQRLVLTGRAPQLARYYPNLGGTEPAEHAWPDFEPVLREHVAELRAALEIAPQTNEPGRSVPLLVGLFDAVRRSGLTAVRLLEVGASAGLNLLVDRFFVAGDGWSYGPADSPLQLLDAVVGPVEPEPFTVIERRGCDLAPIDAASEEGRLRLTSFVWPHDLHRFQRLRAALEVAAAYPVIVDEAPAAEWLTQQLAGPPEAGVLTVVWHSITRQYWPTAEVASVESILTEAGRRMPIAHIAMESPVLASSPASDMRGYQPPLLTVWLAVPGGMLDAVPGGMLDAVPGGMLDEAPVVLGTVADHGVPLTLTTR